MALDSQADNLIRLITLIKSIYNALTYIIYKLTFYGYEANMSISRDTNSDPDVGCRSFASSLFALFYCFFLFTAFSSPLFLLFLIYFLLYLLHFFFNSFSYLYFLFHLSLFVSFTSSFLPSFCKASFHTFIFASCVPCSLFHDFNLC
jgi:hypothetical protein